MSADEGNREGQLLPFPSVELDSRVWVGGNQVDAKRFANRRVAGCRRLPVGPLDLAIVAAMDVAEAAYFARKLRARLAADSRLVILMAASNNDDDASAIVTRHDIDDAICAAGYVSMHSSGVGDSWMAHIFRTS